jgi:hypothetical protein
MGWTARLARMGKRRQDTVHFGRRALVRIVSEAVHPNLWRVVYPDGELGTIGRRTRPRRSRNRQARDEARKAARGDQARVPGALVLHGLGASTTQPPTAGEKFLRRGLINSLTSKSSVILTIHLMRSISKATTREKQF